MNKAQELKLCIQQLCTLRCENLRAIYEGDVIEVQRCETAIEAKEFEVNRLIDELCGEKK
ncbi:hypothetical protein RaK2_00296 [Klebsiella phage vB_KleM_RaK2]|uniref:Uncharacterized protein n=1 Tax=Klebsiella phage vB_KleM_RaK2 TaxID=1147094 RepID=H6X4A3_9CAUD|nr:hypothetical protein F403_gp239 [Klebsiella phage vB_KleM_RaK2]AFA44569.1 hypothetical protein RaK2_00296 [Klebsiella phage vB_KleM_RaK2]